MSKIQIDTIPTEPQLSLLSDTETNVVFGGRRSLANVNVNVANNIGVIVNPTIVVNTQLAGSIGNGFASNFANINIDNFTGLGQSN
ncbi:hypothetical protein I4641_07290 [Waterburya agarophytonicola K14]|uniref:Uncharacterized protein n=1 Tax=Waterburya agarophytonicola KI4 TaxID=2874699 RepID=A0A964BQ70_9CYAN|nr:hypothetical protein [Waterburya agarophytonicola]MCC0176781.1 hypothetical protein [Waterburya agarophytonicola KI4]